jgi:hypothetical protein
MHILTIWLVDARALSNREDVQSNLVEHSAIAQERIDDFSEYLQTQQSQLQQMSSWRHHIGYNTNLTGHQKEGVRQKLISTNRKVFEREHASVESLTALIATHLTSSLSTLRLCMNVELQTAT